VILPTNLHSATLPRLLFAEPTDYCLQPNPFALVWTGASAQRTKTPESDDLSSWGDATVHLTHINPMEALSIEIAQLQDVFHTQTLAKFMVDLSVLRSGVDHEMWVQAIGGYMTAEQERTYRKAQELFNGVDQDGNGLLDMDEVRALFESMNLEVTDEQHAKAYGEMDDDGNGEVDFDEFHEWYANHQHSIEKIWKPRVSAVLTVQNEPDGGESWVSVDLKLPPWAVPRRPGSAKKMTVDQEREEALDLFKEIDLDDSGALDVSEIKHLSQAMGVVLSDAEALMAMKAMGSDGEDEIDFETFFLWWQANQSRATGMKSKLMSKMKLRSRSMLRNSQSPVGNRRGSGASTLPPDSPSGMAKDPEEVRRFFDLVDENGNGLLDREEVRLLSQRLGSELSEQDLSTAMDDMDPLGHGVDFEQFSKWYSRLDGQLDSGGSIFKRGFLSYFRSPSPSKSRTSSPSKNAESPTSFKRDPAVQMRLESERKRREELRAMGVIEDNDDNDDESMSYPSLATRAEPQAPALMQLESEPKSEPEAAVSLGLTGSASEDQAAAKMQATVRGKQDRKKVAELKAEKIESELGLTGSEEEAAQIAKMQATVRGKQDRKKVAELKACLADDALGSDEADLSVAALELELQVLSSSMTEEEKAELEHELAELQLAQAEFGTPPETPITAQASSIQMDIDLALARQTSAVAEDASPETSAAAAVAAAEEADEATAPILLSSLTGAAVGIAMEEVAEHLPMGWEMHYPEEEEEGDQ
jgi:Ca2+-binding EF-hand superfamily protein